MYCSRVGVWVGGVADADGTKGKRSVLPRPASRASCPWVSKHQLFISIKMETVMLSPAVSLGIQKLRSMLYATSGVVVVGFCDAPRG